MIQKNKGSEFIIRLINIIKKIKKIQLFKNIFLYGFSNINL